MKNREQRREYDGEKGKGREEREKSINMMERKVIE